MCAAARMLARGQIKIDVCFFPSTVLVLAWCTGHGKTGLAASLASRQSFARWGGVPLPSKKLIPWVTKHQERKKGVVLQVDELPDAILHFEVPSVPRESWNSKTTLKYLLHMGRYQLLVHPSSV